MDATGGCLCGALRYTVKAEPALIGVCHCRDCQKFTGSAFSFLVGVPLAALEIEGSSKTFDKPGDSGHPITRRFCPECGSGLPRLDEERQLAVVPFGSLDDDPHRGADDHIFVGSKSLWYPITDDLPQLEGAPQ